MQLQLDLPPWCIAVAWHHGSGVGLTEALDAQKRSRIVDILRHCRAGTTTFRHYYTTPKPEDDIGHWCEAVRRQVWQAIRKQGKGHLFVRLQHAAAHRQRDTARRAPARHPQRQQPPPQAADDASCR